MQETDKIIGGFAEQELDKLSLDHLRDFDKLLDVPDVDLLNWILGKEDVPKLFDNQIFMGEKQRAHFWSSPITNDGRYPFVFVMFAIGSLRFQSAVSRGYSIRLIKEI